MQSHLMTNAACRHVMKKMSIFAYYVERLHMCNYTIRNERTLA